MSGNARLFANLGAEEGAGWRRMASHPRVRAVARHWEELFREPAAFPFLSPAEPVLFPWLATEEAAELARREGVPLGVAPPEIALAVHDKAFARAAAVELGLEPEALAGASFALDPEELRDADEVLARIEREVASWPAALRAHFVLKPRLGTSGRGRLAAREGRLDPDSLRGNLERLRARGGVVVEPWLERALDLSAQLHVDARGDVALLGTLRAITSSHGVPLGHAGRIAPDGAIDSGTKWDDALRAAALALGARAAAAGFRGTCGVDALVFRGADGSERLRPIVELNARFTAGTVALGAVRRALRSGDALGARAFRFGFDEPSLQLLQSGETA